MLLHGKYRGHTYEYVKANDRRYCAWLMEEHRDQPLPRDLRDFAKELAC